MRLITLILILFSFNSPLHAQEEDLNDFLARINRQKAESAAAAAAAPDNGHAEAASQQGTATATSLKSTDKLGDFAVQKGFIEPRPPTAAELNEVKAQYKESLTGFRQVGTPLYLKGDISRSVPVFIIPGFLEEDCHTQNGCAIKERIAKTTKIISTGITDIKESGKADSANYEGFVKVEYGDDKKIGWMETALLTLDKNYKPLYTPPDKDGKVEAAAICDHCAPAGPLPEKTKDELEQIAKQSNMTEAQKHAFALQSQIDIINPMVGLCVMNKPKEKIHRAKIQFYDEYVLPTVNKAAQKSTGPTPEKIIEIDGCARAIWAEMHTCLEGPEYAMTIARIFANRADYSEKTGSDEFVREGDFPHSPLKSTLARVCTVPIQVSSFNNSLTKTGPINPNLGKVACPPSVKPDKNFYFDSYNVPQDWIDQWNSAVRIATELILFREQFYKRTEQLGGIYFYTSKGARIRGITQKVIRSIEGHRVGLSKCINTFADQPGYHKARAPSAGAGQNKSSKNKK